MNSKPHTARRRIGTAMTAGLFSFAPWGAGADDGMTSAGLSWLFALPDWVLLAALAGAFAGLSLLACVLYGRWRGPRGHGARTPYYAAAIGAVAGIAVALLSLHARKSDLYESINLLPPPAAGIPSRGSNPDLERLSQALAGLHTQYQVADPGQRGAIVQQMRKVARERRDYLASIIADNPGEVLREALPGEMRASLPEEVQGLVEEETDQEGEIETLHVDFNDPTQNQYRYFLYTRSGERISLHFADHAPDVLTGTRVRVHGVFLKGAGPSDLGETAGAMAIQDGEKNLETLALTSASTSTTSAAALPNTFGLQNTLVILVNFPDNATQPYTTETARNVVFGSVSDYDLENSFQQTSLAGDVVGWYAISISTTVCDYNTLASQSKQAATNAGVNPSGYNRIVYAFPQNSCAWWGLGTVGGNPSQAWINGSLALKVVGHEMGHNFGLYHAHSLNCGTTTLGSSCTTDEYGDTMDMMGGTAAGHYDAFEKERMGWLNYGSSPAIETAQADGDYWLDPYESALSVNAKALKILKSTDSTTDKKTWYYLEYRQAVGFDGFLSKNSNVLNGVVVRTGSESSGNTSNLLDMSPTSPASFNYPALAVGQSFNDPGAGVTITPTYMDGSLATVNVSFGTLPCVHANPAVSLSPTQSQWVQSGTPTAFAVTVANKDSSVCAPAAFNLTVAVPSGWSGVFAQTALSSLAPGAGASTTLTVVSPTTAADGFYTVPVTATNGADAKFTASSPATVVLVSSLKVTEATDKSSYVRGQTVYATASVSANGSAVANVAVTFKFTKSNGSMVSVNTVTDSSGTAKASLRLGKRDPTGIYSAMSQASAGTLTGSASVSFSVQ